MARRPALRALAERAGILPGYEEAGTGARRATSDAARVRLLAALGLPAEREADARRSLERLEAVEAARVLEPTRVLRAGRRAPLLLGAGAAPGRRVEAVLVREGECDPAWRARARAGARGTRLPALPPGVHRLRVRVQGAGGPPEESEQTLLAAPARAWSPGEALGRRRAFGLWANVWSLRTERGFGDATALAALARFAGRAGAAFVGVNPLHALRNRGAEVSPYAPVSRLFRNPLYLDLERVPELAESARARRLLEADARRRRGRALAAAERVDYAGLAAHRRPVLEVLHARFARAHRERDTARGRAYAAFRRREGTSLRDFATFCALEEAFAAEGRPRDWRAWPARFRDPASPAVARFREAHSEHVDLHAWLQFELDRQLGRAAAAGRRAGLALGLYQDLAVGSAPSGFDAWAHPELFVPGAEVGAPPDAYSASGQAWGLPPLHPHRLAETGFAHWRALLRAGLRHSGMLRVDHVMGLFRQWWVPAGSSPAEGAYVRFPHRPLLALLALESRRARALVVGEDLGTVPRGLPARLARRGILSSRVLLFERTPAGGFKRPGAYSRRALATANTHDLPPLAGYWEGRDLERRLEAGALGADELEAARRERAGERRALLRRLRAEGLLRGREAEAPSPEALARAVHAFLLRTPAPLVGLALDDLAGEREPVNLPGVSMERHPSWTRRMARPLADLLGDPALRAHLDAARRRARRGR